MASTAHRVSGDGLLDIALDSYDDDAGYVVATIDPDPDFDFDPSAIESSISEQFSALNIPQCACVSYIPVAIPRADAAPDSDPPPSAPPPSG